MCRNRIVSFNVYQPLLHKLLYGNMFRNSRQVIPVGRAEFICCAGGGRAFATFSAHKNLLPIKEFSTSQKSYFLSKIGRKPPKNVFAPRVRNIAYYRLKQVPFCHMINPALLEGNNNDKMINKKY